MRGLKFTAFKKVVNFKLTNYYSVEQKQKLRTMKKYLSNFTAVLLLSMAVSFASNAQFVIKVRPGTPVVRVRPIAPGPRHVWVSGEYVWRSGQYYYNDGYWATPPSHHKHWVEGRWKHRRGGWIWIPGHWK